MSAGAVAGAAAGSLIGQSVFGGFAPFPNSIMIPFMGAQSAVLGYQFGLFYETGKRTIKAMDNDLFNRIVSGSNDKINIIRNGIETTIPINQYIPTLIKSQWREQITSFRSMLPDAQSLMNDIIQQSVQIENKKAERTPSAWVEIAQHFAKGALETFPDSPDTTGKKLEDTIGFLSAFTGIPFDQIVSLLNLPPFFKVPPPPEKEKEPEPPEPEPEIITGQDEKEPEPPQIIPPPPPIPDPSKDFPLDKQTFNLKLTVPEWGLFTLSETHTRSDWNKIITFWHGRANTEQTTSGKYHLIWRALIKAFTFFYGSYP